MKMTRARAKAALAAAVLIVVAAVALSAPARRVNPPVTGDIGAPPAAAVPLRRACYDCHSNETAWPWYSRVAPLSGLIAGDVEGGRRQINFSEWNSYLPATRLRKLRWLERSLNEETMPPWYYVVLHPSAALSAADLAALRQWAHAEVARQSQTDPTRKEK